MTALFRSELLKIRTTRAWWAYLVVLVLLSGLATAGTIGGVEGQSRSDVEFQVDLVDVAGFATLLAILLGITIVTTEFRHGTITPTSLVEPRRERVVAAKAVAGVAVALLFVLISLVVVVTVAIPWLSALGEEIRFGEREALTRAGELFLGAALWALMGLAIGTVVHSQVAALVGTLVWLFIVETILSLVLGLDRLNLDGVIPYLPFHALDAADGGAGDNLLSYRQGVAASLAWIAALGTAGVVRTGRRDLT